MSQKEPGEQIGDVPYFPEEAEKLVWMSPNFPKIKGNQMTVSEIFTIAVEALKKEHKELCEAQAKFHYKPSDEIGCGIADLEEKHIQYILYKAFLQYGQLMVSYEEPYGNNKCDLVLYNDEIKENIWIEIKVHGYCTDGEYKKWTMIDIEKLKTLRQRGAHKYCLITALDNTRPDEHEWKEWVEKNLPEVVFNTGLFKFFEIKFSDKKRFIKGYYTICLLEIKNDSI